MIRTLIAIGCLATAVWGAQYAVLVAGSNGYWNYRHQADVCHAYHVLINHGFAPANIILFSYNDVPTAALNPFPGTLYNFPGNHSVNVNEGCVKDYTGAAVNVTNFLAVITGNKTAVHGGNGKVLKSGPNDDVFINFVDHGAPGLVAFPDTYLYADQLNSSLTYMHEHKMYRKLVFYLEACESGSMFQGILSSRINVYATTAANTSESSWGTYCSPDSVIKGVNLMTCLGDLYSVNWMQNSDKANFATETLHEQFISVRNSTDQSHVKQYGNLTIASDTLNMFQGPGNGTTQTTPDMRTSHWRSYDVKLRTLYSLFVRNPSDENSLALISEINYRQDITQTFQTISTLLDPTGAENLFASATAVRNFDCLRSSMDTFAQQCGWLQEYGLQYVNVLVNACEVGHSLAELNGAFTQACPAQRLKVE